MNTMTKIITSLHVNWMVWAHATLVLLVCWLVGFWVRKILFYYLGRMSQKTETQLDDIIIEKSRLHVLFWAFVVGLYFAGEIAPVSASTLSVFHRFLTSSIVISITFLIANIASALMKTYGERLSLSLPLTSLTENLIKLVIVVVGILVLLSHLGISITPMLTALGVGSLAVALALQDTLSNLFAGFYILANKQIRPGDYIRLDSGQEGYIVDIGWRATRIKELSNNIILVPNAKVGSAIVTNFSFPETEMSMSVRVGVAYGSDLDKVERVTLEVAREVLRETPGGIATYEPYVRFHTFADSAIEFNVGFRIREFVDQYLLKHEFIKRLHRRYLQENIDIPFPQRVVRVVKE